jgi:DNA/RNA-binding domain of Phe-tRNA-synthetase-like protein
MTSFQIEPVIFERFPELRLGVLLLNNVNNTSQAEELEHLLITAQEKVRSYVQGLHDNA